MDKVISSPKEIANKILLFTLILSLGFGQLLRFQLSGLTVYFHDIVVILLLFLNTSPTLFRNRTFIDRRIVQFGVLALLSLLLNNMVPIQDRLINSLYLFRTIAYLSLVPVLRRSKHRTQIIPLLLASGAITAIIGLLQYFLLPDTRYLYELGWDDHLNRLIFPHYDPTFTGAILSLTLLLSLTFKNRLTTLLTLPAILLTYSRSIFLALAATLLTKSKKFMILIIIIAVGALLLPQKFGEGTNLLRTYSIESRLQHDLEILKMSYTSNPIFGVGMNNLPYYLESSDLPNHANTPNNSYIYLFSTTGIVGLFVFTSLLKLLYKESPHKISVLFIFISSIFNNILFYPFTLIWLVMLVNSGPERNSSTSPNVA